jgi:hypothetical protein
LGTKNKRQRIEMIRRSIVEKVGSKTCENEVQEEKLEKSKPILLISESLECFDIPDVNDEVHKRKFEGS